MIRAGSRKPAMLAVGVTPAVRAFLGRTQVWPEETARSAIRFYEGFYRLELEFTDESGTTWYDGRLRSTYQNGVRICSPAEAKNFLYAAEGSRGLRLDGQSAEIPISTVSTRAAFDAAEADLQTGAAVLLTGEPATVTDPDGAEAGKAYPLAVHLDMESDSWDGFRRWWIVVGDFTNGPLSKGSASVTYGWDWGGDRQIVREPGLFVGYAGLAGAYHGEFLYRYAAWPAPEPEAWATTLQLHITSSNLTQNLYYTQSAANGVTIDWGDGSTAETVSDLSATATHTYAAAGDYTVTMTAGSGVTWWPGTSGFLYGYNILGADMFDVNDSSPQLVGVRLDEYVSQIMPPSFCRCTSLTRMTIPESVQEISSLAFSGCTALESAEISAGRIRESAFVDCTSLHGVWLRNAVETIDVSVSQGARSCTPPWANVADDFTIYCEADSRPAGWNEYFNVSRSASAGTEKIYPVVWGQKTRPW